MGISVCRWCVVALAILTNASPATAQSKLAWDEDAGSIVLGYTVTADGVAHVPQRWNIEPDFDDHRQRRRDGFVERSRDHHGRRKPASCPAGPLGQHRRR